MFVQPLSPNPRIPERRNAPWRPDSPNLSKPPSLLLPPFRYDYALVYTGSLRHCVATIGKCVSVPGTDVSERTCVNYDCSDVEITCPPAEAAGRMCPGYDEAGACDTVVDDLGKPNSYNTQYCNGIPRSQPLFVSCLEAAGADQGHVCYFAQSGSYAPFSFTCYTGNCVCVSSQRERARRPPLSRARGLTTPPKQHPRRCLFSPSLSLALAGTKT